jgi:hypothetical protein
MAADKLEIQRAFVLQLQSVEDGSTDGFAGRVEHITSGAVTHFKTLQEFVDFIARVLASVSRT